MACKNKCNPKPRPVYDKLLQVQAPGTTTADDGQLDPSDSNWVNKTKIYARFLTRGGSESRVFQQIEAVGVSIIETRWSRFTDTIDPSWRLTWGTRRFNIEFVENVDEKYQVCRMRVKERK